MNFQWIQCSFFLKKIIGNAELTINLTPFHKLQFYDQENQLQDINIDVKIQFEKSLMYESNIGWNWHKSWNIPDVLIQLNSHDIQIEYVLKNLKKLHAEIYAVKPIISKQYSLCIQDLGLQGNTCIQFSNNKCIFSGLKFSATSYNSQGSKFHFLVIIFENTQKLNEQSKIVLSRISSPIFVDSRKSARQAELIKLKKMSAYIQPFQISHINKKFIKKQSKKSKDYTEEQIQNNLNGLYNYFGAANIRNKVKHPLFLGIKFDMCFYIYYNTNLLTSKQTKTIIQFLQQSLFQIYKNFQIYKPPNKLDNKKIILAIKNQNLIGKFSHIRKTPQFLQFLQCDTIGIMIDNQVVPPNFQQIKITNNIIQQYEHLYLKFKKQHDNLFKNKQKQLKLNPVDMSDIKTSKKQMIINQPPSEQINNKDGLKRIRQISICKQQINQQQQSESISSQSFLVQRPNIPLKCEITIDPIKKRCLKLQQIINIYNQTNNQKQQIKCEKKINSDQKELIIMNSLLKIEVEDRKSKLKIKQKEINSNLQKSKNYFMNLNYPQNPLVSYYPQVNLYGMLKY